jgi:excisionase family DNA binding protein
MSRSPPTITPQMVAEALPTFVTAHQIAEAIGCADSTIYLWVQQGYIPHVRLGRCVRFSLREVQEWLAQAAKPGPQTDDACAREETR